MKLSPLCYALSLDERSLGSESRHLHSFHSLYLVTSTIVIRRHPRNQEREFLSHIDARKELLDKLITSTGERENHIHNLAGAAQS